MRRQIARVVLFVLFLLISGLLAVGYIASLPRGTRLIFQ